MDRKSVVTSILQHLEKEVGFYRELAEKERLNAIDGEIKQEGKYDTRAIEAGYLAGAQKRRLEEVQIEQQKFQSLKLENYSSSSYSLCSLLKLEKDGESAFWVFISPFSGAHELQIDQEKVQVISKETPLAKRILNLEADEEEFELKVGAKNQDWTILKHL